MDQSKDERVSYWDFWLSQLLFTGLFLTSPLSSTSSLFYFFLFFEVFIYLNVFGCGKTPVSRNLSYFFADYFAFVVFGNICIFSKSSSELLRIFSYSYRFMEFFLSILFLCFGVCNKLLAFDNGLLTVKEFFTRQKFRLNGN